MKKKKSVSKIKREKLLKKSLIPIVAILFVLSFGLFIYFYSPEPAGDIATGGQSFDMSSVESIEDLYHDGENLRVYYFWTSTCPMCTNYATPFIEEISQEYPIEIVDIQLDASNPNIIQRNEELTQEFEGLYNTDIAGVPVTAVGDQIWTGHSPDQIENKIQECLDSTCEDPLQK